jgi:hypothetical protein
MLFLIQFSYLGKDLGKTSLKLIGNKAIQRKVIKIKINIKSISISISIGIINTDLVKEFMIYVNFVG